MYDNDKIFKVEFLTHPMLQVRYLVDHPNGSTDQSLPIGSIERPDGLILSMPIGSTDDVVRYTFHVMAKSERNALAIANLHLAEAVREDYDPDAYADIVWASAVVVDD